METPENVMTGGRAAPSPFRRPPQSKSAPAAGPARMGSLTLVPRPTPTVPAMISAPPGPVAGAPASTALTVEQQQLERRRRLGAVLVLPGGGHLPHQCCDHARRSALAFHDRTRHYSTGHWPGGAHWPRLAAGTPPGPGPDRWFHATWLSRAPGAALAVRRRHRRGAQLDRPGVPCLRAGDGLQGSPGGAPAGCGPDVNHGRVVVALTGTRPRAPSAALTPAPQTGPGRSSGGAESPPACGLRTLPRSGAARAGRHSRPHCPSSRAIRRSLRFDTSRRNRREIDPRGRR